MNKETVLRELYKLKHGGPHILSMGICSHVKVPTFILQTIWIDWPKYSGHLEYPVPPADYRLNMDVDAKFAFMYTTNLWVGEYGNLRRELLDFMIKQLEQEDYEIRRNRS